MYSSIISSSALIGLIAIYVSISNQVCNTPDSADKTYSIHTCVTPINDILDHITPLSTALSIPKIHLLTPTSLYDNLLHSLTNLPLAASPSPSPSSSSSPSPSPPKRYRLIIDAGSTGSRLFIYDVSDPSSPDVIRVGSQKTTPGLNAFTQVSDSSPCALCLD